jgi:hypothetical protein
MRKRKLILVALGCLVLAAIAVLITRDVSGLPVDIRFVSSATHGATRDVTVEFRRSNPDAFFYDTSQVQTRVAGHWSPLQDFPDSPDLGLLATKSCENIVFAVPADADACRFCIAYRLRGVSSCRVYGFLNRHGITPRFPRLSRLVAHCVAWPPRLHHAEAELSLPSTPPETRVAAN